MRFDACGYPKVLLAGICARNFGYPSKRKSFLKMRISFSSISEETSEEKRVKSVLFHLFSNIKDGMQ